MFCEKCGNELQESAKFCHRCGNQAYRDKGNDNFEESLEKDRVLLQVNPSTNLLNIFLPKLFVILPVIIVLLIIMFFVFKEEFISARIITVLLMMLSLISVVVDFVNSLFLIEQYRNKKYIFYGDRMIFEDTFVNLSYQELKYRHIIQVTKRQDVIQKWFNIGDVLLYSDAEGKEKNGIFLLHIEDINESYNKIKSIVGI